ncbi:hypothetical protein ACFYXC_13400 [Streptomyces sp. NPDC002701]|uniref:hypothetical protein n=1 Tax=Streptomyces sp. NPDC002701 TaxID=3364661 RepID=UPI00367D53D8
MYAFASAQSRKVGLGRDPAAVVRGGTVQQQLVTGPEQGGVLEGSSSFSPSRSSWKTPLSQ